MADKKISQLSGATTPLTGTEQLAIVQGGSTVKATAQDIADLGGGGSPFNALINIPTVIVDIANALEGTSIPDSATANYTKTIPLGISPTTALCVLLCNSLGTTPLRKDAPLTYGVASTGLPNMVIEQYPAPPNPASALGPNGQVETPIRILLNNNYLQAKRAQSMFSYGTGFGEADETGQLLPGGHVLSYVQLNNNLIGRYNGPAGGAGSIGLTSSTGNTPQDNTILKSAYISGSNLVLLLKKTNATSGETWNRLQFRVYDLS